VSALGRKANSRSPAAAARPVIQDPSAYAGTSPRALAAIFATVARLHPAVA
jgi:hypothetical protein